MGIREGILVLLGQGTKHGYQLKRDFEQATGEAWPLNVGQVYTTLQRLERDGLVREGSADADGRVDYSLTDEGRAEYHDWMQTPEQRSVPSRDEVAMKVLLATVSTDVDALAVIDEQRRATMQNLQEYSRLRQRSDHDVDLAWLLQLDRLILMRQAELRWLDDVEERLSTVDLTARNKALREQTKESKGGVAP